MVYVDGFHLGHTLLYGRLLEGLACAELAYGARLFEFSLELLQSFLDIFAILYRYDNHFKITSFFFGTAKI